MISLYQLLHLFDFSLLWAAMVERTHQLSPKELTLTMMIVISSVHYALSSFLVNMFGGVLYEQLGGPALFFGCGVVCGVWGVLIAVYHYLAQRRGGPRFSTALALRS